MVGMVKFVKRILLFLSLSVFSMLSYGQSELDQKEGNSTRVLTLREAMDIALEENPTIIIAGKEIELKKEAKKEVIWNLLPDVSINGSYSYTIKQQTMAMDMGGEVQTFKVGMKHNYTGSLNVGIPLFAPALYKTMALSKEDIKLAMEKSRSSKLDLMNEVVRAYFQALLSQDSFEVLSKSLAQAEENLEIVTSKFKFGKVSEYDKIRADVQMRNLKPAVIAAKNAVRLSKMQLYVLLGIEDSWDFSVGGTLKEFQGAIASGDMEYFKGSQVDLSRNSNLLQLDLSENILHKRVQLARTNYFPTISLDYNYTYMAMDNKADFFNYNWYPTSSIGVKFTVPLFRGSNITKVKQAKIELAKMYYTKIHTERQLLVQASTFQDNMRASIEQIGSNEVNVYQALKGREIARKMYEVGKGTILELNDSEVALVQAELAYNQAIFDYLVARSDYAKIIGDQEFFQKINNDEI